MSKDNNCSAPYKAIDIAEYFIYLSSKDPIDEDENKNPIFEGITNLKLQKILYFAQAYFMVKTSQPLFEEKIEAWKYGPVVREVYAKYKENGSSPIFNKENNFKLSIEDQRLMEAVWEIFGKHSASKLVDIVHHQAPWVDSYQRRANNEIKALTLKEYYKGMFVVR